MEAMQASLDRIEVEGTGGRREWSPVTMTAEAARSIR